MLKLYYQFIINYPLKYRNNCKWIEKWRIYILLRADSTWSTDRLRKEKFWWHITRKSDLSLKLYRVSYYFFIKEYRSTIRHLSLYTQEFSLFSVYGMIENFCLAKMFVWIETIYDHNFVGVLFAFASVKVIDTWLSLNYRDHCVILI